MTLLNYAFRALGASWGPDWWLLLAEVSDLVRGDEESTALFQQAAGELGKGGPRPAWEELERLAEANGATGFDVLDLVTQVSNPDAHADLREPSPIDFSTEVQADERLEAIDEVRRGR
jgi:hypothetical protein